MRRKKNTSNRIEWHGVVESVNDKKLKGDRKYKDERQQETMSTERGRANGKNRKTAVCKS